ncbi:MAG: putative LPS assembly protein LptD, partial [Rhodocyclaceae bacterium]|nr:putative LPS assembly protein LptD [Rhodocyclaceae bacterium]
MRVDPALLGAAAPAGEPVAPASAPPEVGERPALPPLYSAHVAAGAIPHPATTPFAFADKQKAPTYVSAERIEGVYEVELIASGAARFERRGDALEAERIHYREALDEVEAIGNVRLSSPDTTLTGPRLRMRLEESTGEFITPAYTFRRERKPVQEPALTLTGLPAVSEGGQTIVGTGRMIAQAPFTGSGQAERLEFRGIDAYRLEKASYSTCAPGARDWEIHIDALDLDYHDEIGQGRHAVVRFKDVPIFYTPWLSFSLNDQKKSGFLPPTFGSTSKSGFELATPWFWNIAPHMDATLTPRYLTRRGLQMNGEFRYLLNSPQNRALAANAQLSADALPDKGQLRVEWLPDDRVAQRNRYGYAFTHNQTFLSLVPGHTVTANLNVNGVSDSNYFSDLSTRVATVSQG